MSSKKTSMSRTIRLDQIRIASPCPRTWDSLVGDDKKRFCDDCNLHVYNFAAMTQAEAEDLICSTEGRLCSAIYRRADGTIITRDCSIGLAAVKRRARWMAAKVAAGVLLALSLGAYAFAGRSRVGSPFNVNTVASSWVGQPFAALKRWSNPPPMPSQRGMILGKVAVPSLPKRSN